jgi:hypothetical protein
VIELAPPLGWARARNKTRSMDCRGRL